MGHGKEQNWNPLLAIFSFPKKTPLFPLMASVTADSLAWRLKGISEHIQPRSRSLLEGYFGGSQEATQPGLSCGRGGFSHIWPTGESHQGGPRARAPQPPSYPGTGTVPIYHLQIHPSRSSIYSTYQGHHVSQQGTNHQMAKIDQIYPSFPTLQIGV